MTRRENNKKVGELIR